MSIINNRKAKFEYSILKEFEAGIVLVGSEVKPLMEGKANIIDAFVYIKDNEVFLKNMYISTHKESSYLNHEETRDRKLLLHKKEINDIKKLLRDNGVTTIPLEVYSKKSHIKIKIAVAKGKNARNKKNDIKSRDIKRSIKRDFNVNI